MWSRCICPPIAVRGEISSARRSDGNRTMPGQLFTIEWYPPGLRSGSARPPSGAWTEAFRSPDDFEMNVFIKIVRAPSKFWRHRPVTGQGPDGARAMS